MINNQQRLFESIADTASRSRLEPYREVILRWRRGRVSYRRILKALAANGVTVGRMTLYEFVQRRSRPRTAEPEDPPVERMQPDPPEHKPIRSKEETPLPRRSPEEIAAMRAAASGARHKPAFPTPEAPKPWEYDPDRPLSNIKPTTKDTTPNVSSRSNRNPEQ
jgi:hypothetical protein